jgi:hypothetical protein
MPRFTVKQTVVATALIAVGVGVFAACGRNTNRSSTTRPANTAADSIQNTFTDIKPMGRPAENVRRIPIPQREHGYKNFKSRVLRNKEELAAFLKDVAQQEHWNEKAKFLAALNFATIDFDKEELLLIRTTAGSGSMKISLAEPTIVGTDIVFHVVWDLPGAGTKDMNYQCFAVIIPKGAATNAKIVTDFVVLGKPSSPKMEPEVIPLSDDK